MVYSVFLFFDILIVYPRASVQILDINRPGEIFVSSSLDLTNCNVRTVKIVLSPSLELLLVDKSIYHIDIDKRTMASTPIPIPIPLLVKDQFENRSVSCIFSSCNTYLAIAVDPFGSEKPLAALCLYHIATKTKAVSIIEIPNLHLEDCAGLKIDFHPTKTDLAVGYWIDEQREDEQKINGHVRCYTLNLQTMDLEPARLYPQIQRSQYILKSLSGTLVKRVMLTMGYLKRSVCSKKKAPYDSLIVDNILP